MADFQPPQLDWLHQVIGMRLVDVVFGAAGSLVRSLVMTNLSWPQLVSSIDVGALTAGSIGPDVNAIIRRSLDTWGAISHPSRSAALQSS